MDDWADRGAHVKVGDIHIGIRPGPDGTLVVGPISAKDAGHGTREIKDAIDKLIDSLSTKKGRDRAVGEVEKRTKTFETGTDLEKRRAPELQKVADRLRSRAPIETTTSPIGSTITLGTEAPQQEGGGGENDPQPTEPYQP